MFFSDSESSMPTMMTSVEMSIEAITSGVKPGRRVDDHEVGHRAQDAVHLAQELDRDDARLVGPRRCDQHPRAATRASSGSRRASRRRASRRPSPGRRPCGPARCRARARRRRTAGRGRRARPSRRASASATARLVETSVLPVPPFGPRTQMSGAVVCPAAVVAPCRRASTFCSENPISSGSAESEIASSAPASKTRRR